MTLSKYEQRKKILDDKKIKYGELNFRGQKPIDYLKIEVFETEMNQESFHWDKNGKLVDYQKTFILDLGGLCGIEAAPFVSEKLSKYSYLSKSNLYRLLPSGNREHCSAEYEFDAEIRGEETVLKDEVYNMNSPDKRKYKNTAQERLVVTQLAVLGRSKADTGSHKRGIIKMLKLPSAKPEFVGTHLFCFRCVPDMSNPEVRQGFLESQNPGSVVFGRIEHKQDDIVQKQEETVPDENFEIEMSISSEMETLKDRPAIYKLAGIILNKKFELEKFREYIFGYSKLNGADQMITLIDWISKIEEVEESVVKGDATVRKYFLQAWGK